MVLAGIGEGFAETAFQGSLLLAIPIAIAAGLVSFLSPCVLPLVPGYLSYVTGLSGADLESARRGRMVGGALLFVAGFGVVFVSAGVLFGALGSFLATYDDLLMRIFGGVAILLGLAFVGLIPWLSRDIRVHKVPAVGLVAAPLLGATFGLGWTPCIGPTLGVVMSLATSEGTVGRGAVLSIAYTLGLGIPFILVALAFRRMVGALGWVRRHQVWVTRIGGGMLITVGLLLVTGLWTYAIAPLQQWSAGFDTAL